ncbi:MAG: D-alanyl-D-alanine carboxypeptidase family protein [Sporolactobacillus sp.]
MTVFLKKMLVASVLLLLVVPLFSLHRTSAQAPAVSAQTAALMELATGRLLDAKDSHRRLPIASITKVMTALLAIESGKMNDTVVVSPEAIRTEGSSIYLKAGERIKLRDLVYGLMLRSGNDASRAIAEAVAGSEQGFVFLMNEKAKAIGMDDTHFANPNGLQNDAHYSSAYDMALLMREAMRQPLFRRITGTKSYSVPATNRSEARLWLNKNKMLRQYPFATGGKTGYTEVAGRTLISTASKDGMELVAVTLNDRDDWRDHSRLFDWGFTTYKETVVMHRGTLNADVSKPYRGHLYVKETLRVPLAGREAAQIKKTLTLIKYTAFSRERMSDEPCGSMQINVGNKTLAEVPVYYQEQVKKSSFLIDFEQVLASLFSGGRSDD